MRHIDLLAYIAENMPQLDRPALGSMSRDGLIAIIERKGSAT
jgi:hypothetical protein